MPDNIFLIILENNDFKDVIKQSFFRSFAHQGTLLTNSHGITHPSQPNYIALTSGNTFISSDETVTLNVTNLVDLLEAKNITWKTYAENYWGKCNLQSHNSCSKPLFGSWGECSAEPMYARKHNPFINYSNVQTNPTRCGKIVNATELQRDIAENKVPQFVLYIPNLANGGHNTNINYADQYMFSTFIPLLRNPEFTRDRIFIITFDESRSDLDYHNHIYTAFWGPHVKKNTTIDISVNHYNLLRTIENHFELGTLGRKDQTAFPITGFLIKDKKSNAKIFKIPLAEEE